VEVLPLEGELLICLRWRFDLQPTQKKKIGEPLQKHLEGKRQEGKGNQGCSWSHTDVTEEDFETTEGEMVDLYDKLMEMVRWILSHRRGETE
jgi:hypothetical protein